MAPGRVFVAGDAIELHHRVPQCLLGLYDAANAGDAWSFDGDGIQKWLDFEHEAMLWGVPVDISREDLAALVDSSTTPLALSDLLPVADRVGHGTLVAITDALTRVEIALERAKERAGVE